MRGKPEFEGFKLVLLQLPYLKRCGKSMSQQSIFLFSFPHSIVICSAWTNRLFCYNAYAIHFVHWQQLFWWLKCIIQILEYLKVWQMMNRNCTVFTIMIISYCRHIQYVINMLPSVQLLYQRVKLVVWIYKHMKEKNTRKFLTEQRWDIHFCLRKLPFQKPFPWHSSIRLAISSTVPTQCVAEAVPGIFTCMVLSNGHKHSKNSTINKYTISKRRYTDTAKRRHMYTTAWEISKNLSSKITAEAWWRQVTQSYSSPFTMATKLGIYATEESGTKNIERNMGKKSFLGQILTIFKYLTSQRATF